MMPLIILAIGVVAAFIGLVFIPTTADQPIQVFVIQDDIGINNTVWGDIFYFTLKSSDLADNYIFTNKTSNELADLRNDGEFDVLIYIPSNFSALINSSKLDHDSTARMFIYYDASDLVNEGAVEEIVLVSAIFNQQLIFLEYGNINLSRVSSIPINVSKGSGALVASTLSIIPLYIVFFLVIPPITLVLISVTIEREQKTLESILLQPIDRKQFIAGKILYGTFIVIINTLLTLGAITGLLIAFFLLIPEDIKQQMSPILGEVVKNLLASEFEFWIFILYIIIGLIIISLLLVSFAVFFSMMARDEREANMVVSALIILPMFGILFLIYLPLGALPDLILTVIGMLPAIGFLFSIYLIILNGELILIVWISLISQIIWILIIIWLSGRLIESEGILQISFKKLLRFWKK
jgi:hypothetical protein